MASDCPYPHGAVAGSGSFWAWFLLVPMLLVALPCGRVAAQQSPSQNRKEAKRLLGQGNNYFKKGNYNKALDVFRRAYRVVPSHKIDYNIAATFDALGEPDQAADHYLRFVRQAEKAGSTGSAATVRALLAERNQTLGRVEVVCDEAGGTVQVAGVKRGKTPQELPLHLAAGAHLITLSKPGHGSLARTVMVTAGQTTVLRLCWKAEAVAGLDVPGRNNNAVWPAPNADLGVASPRRTSGTPSSARLDLDARCSTIPDHYLCREHLVPPDAGDSPGNNTAGRDKDGVKRAGSTPVYKRWWFWTIVGAAAVGAGVGIGVAATAGDDRLPAGELGTIR